MVDFNPFLFLAFETAHNTYHFTCLPRAGPDNILLAYLFQFFISCPKIIGR